MKKWKLHCLQRYRLQHPSRVTMSGLHPTTRSNRPEIPCLPRFLPVYKEKQPGLDWLKHPQQGHSARHPPNSTPELVEVTRPSVSTGPIKREATGPHRTACPNKPFKRRVYAVFDSCTRRCSPTSTNLLNSSEENHTSTVLLTPWERTTQSVTDLHTSTEQNRPIKEACTVF